MSKFRSQVITEETMLPNGKVKPGVTVWIPLDDAAKASNLCEAAIQAGVYKPKDGETPPEMAEKLRKKMQVAAARDKKPY